jgi:hypothetical protein
MKSLIALTFSLAAASPLRAQDIIKFKDPAKNADMEGSIVSMSFKVVEIEMLIGTVLAKRPAETSLIAEILPSNGMKHFDFVQGEVAMSNADFGTAIQRFGRVTNDARASDLMKQMSAINIVRCQSYAGNPRGVLQAAMAMRAKKPDGFYTKESFELEVKAQLALGNPAGAKGAIGAFLALAKANDLQDWPKTGELLQGVVAEFQADWRGALAIYRRNTRDPDVGDEAAFGELRCMSALSDWPGLNARASAIIKESSGKKTFNPRLLIAAYNGKGDVDLSAGKPKEALLNYLRGAWVLSGGATSPEHEAALARSSVACARLSDAERDPAKKETFRRRSVEVLGELRRTYPGSPLIAETEKMIRPPR